MFTLSFLGFIALYENLVNLLLSYDLHGDHFCRYHKSTIVMFQEVCNWLLELS